MGADVETSFSGRFRLVGRSLRQHAARGTAINAAFAVGVGLLAFLRGFVVASFLTAEELGLWGILVVGLGTLMWLRQAGIGDAYLQQDDEDQELAFQRAFTLEAALNALMVVAVLIVLPLLAIAYGRPELVGFGLVLLALLPAAVLQTPLWILTRQLRFGRMRALQAIDPVVGFVAAVVLAAAGAGTWALVLSTVLGMWAAALAAVLTSPYRLRLRWDRSVLRRYASFSGPMIVAGGSALLIAQLSMFCANDAIGLAGVGAITLAATITQFHDRVDQVVGGTLYPAICAVRDRTDLLFESFQKANRLALMWAVPFGVGLALFADDLVAFAIGERWRIAVPVLQAFGLIAALAHVGFNWDAYFRARGDTRPLAVAAVCSLLAFAAIALPLLYAQGLAGFAWGVGAQAAAHLACRWFYLRRLFRGFSLARHAARALTPTALAGAAVLAARLAGDGERSLGLALAEAAGFLVIALLVTWALERTLLREASAYLRGGSGGRVVAAT